MWAEEFNKARSDEKRQVPMLYLANEVLHTGTKKCPDWVQHFASHLPGCLSKLPTGSVVHQKAQRLAQIWRERDILGTGISKVYQVLGVAGPSAPPAAGRPSRAPSKGPKSPSKGGQKVAAAGGGAGGQPPLARDRGRPAGRRGGRRGGGEGHPQVRVGPQDLPHSEWFHRRYC